MPLHVKPRIAVPVPTSQDPAYNQRSWVQYADAVAEAGGTPVECPLGLSMAAVQELAATCQGFCLPGSPADVDPLRYGAEVDPASSPADPARETVDYCLLDYASVTHKPVLGICFGLQSMNVWAGGTLVQDLHSVPVNHSAGRSVAIAHTTLLSVESELGRLVQTDEASISGGFFRLPVNTSHHQAVAAPGEGLRVVGRCPEDGVIEALEQDESWNSRLDRPCWLVGVQWHPERSTSLSSTSRALFRELVRRAGNQLPSES